MAQTAQISNVIFISQELSNMESSESISDNAKPLMSSDVNNEEYSKKSDSSEITQEHIIQKPLKTYKRVKDSDNKNEFIHPKKTAKSTIIPSTSVSTYNFFTPLTTVTSSVTSTPTVVSSVTSTPSTSTANSSDNRPNQTIKLPTPPPLVIEKKCISSKLIIQIKALLKNEYNSTYNAQGLRIQCKTMEDYNIIQYYLAANKLQYFTYQMSTQQHVKVIIRGLPPNFTEEEILVELQDLKFPVISVRQFKRSQVDPLSEVRYKAPLPIWLVTLHHESGIKEKIKQLTGIFSLTIKVEDYEGSSTPMQCYRCQRFGHKAQGCNLQPKCVKCAGSHHTRDCTKDPISPATCSNCEGTHPANYRQCPKYLAYMKPSTSNQNSTEATTSLNPSNFPRLRPARGTLQHFQNQDNTNIEETNNSALSDFKDILSFVKSFDIKHYLSKLKDIIKDVSKQSDVISKCLTFVSGLCTFFDNGSDK